MNNSINIAIKGGRSFTANRGDLLLDAALAAGVGLPHDCRSGHCGSCRVEIISGQIEGREAGQDDVLACQTRLSEDLLLAVDDRPPVETIRGVVTGLSRIATDVFETTIRTSRVFNYLPGQYAQFTFAGFPSRCFSPTLPLSGQPAPDELRLQIQRVSGGCVSDALGKAIRPGHPVRIDGPFGSAYLRPSGTERLVLVASGTGFAPVWSIAQAALHDLPDREMVVVASAKRRDQFYMGRALLRLASFPHVTVYAGLRAADAPEELFFIGDPLDFVPDLKRGDTVYGCGAPSMVEALAQRARQAGARCHADAFSSPPLATESILDITRITARNFMAMLKRVPGSIELRNDEADTAAQPVHPAACD